MSVLTPIMGLRALTILRAVCVAFMCATFALMIAEIAEKELFEALAHWLAPALMWAFNWESANKALHRKREALGLS